MATDYLYEPERYELSEEARYRFALDRRDFFRLVGLGMVVVGVIRAQESGGAGRRRGGGRQRPEEVGPWIHIGEGRKDYSFHRKGGSRTKYAHGVDAGSRRRDPCPGRLGSFGDNGRHGSHPIRCGNLWNRSMPDMLPQMRKAAASAREL